MRPMTRAEWNEWMPRQMAGYAEHIAASGAMSEADARAKAEADTARSFHGGYATSGQLVFRLMAGDKAAGWLWLAVPGPDPDRLMAWVYNIEVDPGFRGRGFGRAAMILAAA
jgi:ribosomal protein S18 acetylase RimI-like enzyme